MPREQRERYAKAVIYAVVEKNLPFATADEFADWWARVGSLRSESIAAGFKAWLSSKPGD
jgi:hypothetical protein